MLHFDLQQVQALRNNAQDIPKAWERLEKCIAIAQSDVYASKMLCMYFDNVADFLEFPLPWGYVYILERKAQDIFKYCNV